jgi:hypothetical protein
MNSIDTRLKWHQNFSQSHQLAAMEEFLSDEEIETLCRQICHTWRQRIFTPGLTVRSMVYRRLHPDKSILATLADLTAGEESLPNLPADSSWCEARSRLPEALWELLIVRSTERLQRLAPKSYLYQGRSVYLADGSTVSMPDTPELVDVFGYANTKHGFSRFPVARITFLTHAGTEAVVDYRMGHYRTGEDTQFRSMWDRLPKGCICICDRKFGSFYNLAKLPQRQVDVLCPLYQRRDPKKLIAGGQTLGKEEWLVWLDLCPQLRRRYDDNSLPKQLPIRLIRVRFTRNGKRKQLWLVTTLLDRNRYSRRSLIRLYRRRWGIETRIGSLKTTLEMNVLPSKTVLAIRYDVAATILAHNLIWTLIQQAAALTQTPASRISFAGTIKLVLSFSASLRQSSAEQRDTIYNNMLANIARQTNRHRPNRIEPRLIKRQKRRYGFLKIPREEARKIA